MLGEKQKLVVICGPTACGKSSLAVDLALQLKGEIVNADSMQVYRGMDIGTAKPILEKRKGVSHHLFDVAEPDQDFNAGLYCSMAVPILKEIASRQRISFLVGGTGLYIKALLGGLLNCPPAAPGFRNEMRRQSREKGPRFLHERLESLDPDSAGRIHPNDEMRVIRALEVIHLTGERFSSLTREHSFKNSTFRTLKICLQEDRERLYHRINERCLSMVKEGLVEETKALLNKGYAPELKPLQSLGYRHVLKHLDGAWNLEETIRHLQIDTRRYAKRQLTWFRADRDVLWFRPEDKVGITNRVIEFLS